jgi:hypothetical protein
VRALGRKDKLPSEKEFAKSFEFIGVSLASGAADENRGKWKQKGPFWPIILANPERSPFALRGIPFSSVGCHGNEDFLQISGKRRAGLVRSRDLSSVQRFICA